MSEFPQPATPQDAGAAEVNDAPEVNDAADANGAAGAMGAAEAVDALPVLSARPHLVPAQARQGALPSERLSGGTVLPAVQAAAVAAGGFVAGAAVVGLVHRRHKRSARLPRGRRGGDRGRRGVGAGELLQIVGSRSVLLDVHLLGGSGDR